MGGGLEESIVPWRPCGGAVELPRTPTLRRGEFKLNIKCRGENERSRMAAGDEGRRGGGRGSGRPRDGGGTLFIKRLLPS